MFRSLLLTMLAALVMTAAASGTTIHVTDDYPTIMDAMVFASRGDTVLVECGVYYEGNIQMKSEVTLISETGLAGCAMIDAQNMGRVIECVDCNDKTAIIGFTIAGGYVTSGYGAGISCTRSSPRLENLRFIVCQVNSATSYGGGGLGCLDSSPTLTNVEFQSCVLQSSTVGGGGAMMTAGQSSPTLNDVTFNMNWTTDSWGGAMSVQGYGGQIVTLNDVLFTGNSASTSGGGLHVSGSTTVMNEVVFHDNWAPKGGGLHLETCRPCTLTNVTFTENTAASGKGGGLLCEMSPDGTATTTDLTFVANTAATDGGGMACNNSTTTTLSYATFAANEAVNGGGLDVAGGAVEIDHATFHANDASGSGGGIHLDAASTLDLDTSIIAFSSDGTGIDISGYTPPVISCTDIFGNFDGDWVGTIAGLYGVSGNFRLDPLFCDSGSSDFTLSENSPCLPAYNSCGALVGAHGQGCGATSDVPVGGESALTLHPATPNPFGRTTALSYELPHDTTVSVRVYDVTGRLVRTLADSERQIAGPKTLLWNGRDDVGRVAASGVYFLKVEAGAESLTRRAVLLR